MEKTRNDVGAAAVEMALLLPLLLLLVFGLIDFGFAYSANIAITNAAHEGSRALSLGEDEADVIQRVKDAANAQDTNVDITTTCDAGGNATVVASREYKFQLLSILGTFGMSGVTVSGEGVERCSV